MDVTIIGWLRKVLLDDHNHQTIDCLYHLETEEDEFVEIIFNSVDQANSTPINKRIALSIKSFDGKKAIVSDSTPHFTFVDDYAEEIIQSKKHVGIFKKVATDISDEEYTRDVARVEKAARFVENYYKYYARHKWDVQVRGYVMRNDDCNVSTPEYCYSAIKRFIDDHDMGGFAPNYFMVWGGSTPGWCGLGQVGGNRSVTQSRCAERTMVHELGHNFGLQHASTVTSDGTRVEYGDKTSVMGTDTGTNGLNSVNLVALNLEGEREKKIIWDESVQVLLSPIELKEHVLHDNEDQNVIIKKRYAHHKDTYISIRKGRGVPQRVKDPETLYVHERDGRRSLRLLPDLKPGESKTLESGTKIEYLDYENESARVNIILNEGDEVNDLVRKEGFPDPIPGCTADESHNGHWYNRFFTGQGFDIQIKNGRMGFYWYTFNQQYDEGSGRYYFGTCDEEDIMKGFDIYTSEGGTFEDPTSAKVWKTGKGQLYFFDRTRGVFNFETEEHGKGSTEIFPLSSTDDPLGGAWYDPSKNKSGFSIQFLDDGGRCALYWYTYGDEPKFKWPLRDPHPTANRTQRWYGGLGEERESGVYDMQIMRPHGGRWLYFDEVDMNYIGEATLTVNSEESMTFEYEIDDSGEKSGKLDLVRLF